MVSCRTEETLPQLVSSVVATLKIAKARNIDGLSTFIIKLFVLVFFGAVK